MTTLTLDQWRAEVARRGELDCRFVCPVCGNAASANDWKRLLPDLTNPDRAATQCIGRAMPRAQVRAAFGLPNGIEKPCDYAAFGLFDVCELHVEMPDHARPVPVFDFEEPYER